MRGWTWILLAPLAVGAVATGGFLGASEWLIHRRYAVEQEPLTADRSEAGVEEGRRLAHILSCFECHGAEGQGRQLVDRPLVATLRPPGLAPIVAQESDAVLARTIRHGVDRNGATLWIMPARTKLADDDAASLVGFLRTLRPTVQDEQRRQWFGPIGRLQILQGHLEPSVRAHIDPPKRRPADIGAYYVGLVCEVCHNLYQPHRVGPNGSVAPPLAYMAAAYDESAFRELMRTGRGLTPGDLGEMGQVARSGFAWFSDDEIKAIRAYLIRKAAEPPPPA